MPNGIGSRIKTGSCQTGQLPGRIKSELCDWSGLRIDLISRLLSLSRLYSGILHSLSLSLSSDVTQPHAHTEPEAPKPSPLEESRILADFGIRLAGLGFRAVLVDVYVSSTVLHHTGALGTRIGFRGL